MKILTLLTALVIGSPLHGQLVGAYETFTEADNANTWKFYDYFVRGDSVAPMWKRPGSEADPEIYASFTQDYGVSLYADLNSSDGYLAGDYVTAGVAGVFCNIFVEDPEFWLLERML